MLRINTTPAVGGLCPNPLDEREIIPTDITRDRFLRRLRSALARRLTGTQRRAFKSPLLVIRALKNTWYDVRRYYMASSAIKATTDAASLAAHITLDYHRFEKGLTLPAPRPGFGRQGLATFLENIRLSETQFGPTIATSIARNVLKMYGRFNRANGIHIPEIEVLDVKRPFDLSSGAGGTKIVSRAAIHGAAKLDLEPFFLNRHSVRNFTPEPVAQELLERAVRFARSTPSVCNRQSGRVYIITEAELKQKALSFQNGNRGFGHTAPAALIVTADMRCFTSIGERNQHWVDGGLFAMSLNYALHSFGLGTCMLNWSVEVQTDREMRRSIGIPDHEAVITMMVTGHLPETFKVAQSPRRALEEIAIFLT